MCEPIHPPEQVHPTYRSFALAVAELVAVAELHSEPEHCYAEFWRLWEFYSYVVDPRGCVWASGRRAAQIVTRRASRWL